MRRVIAFVLSSRQIGANWKASFINGKTDLGGLGCGFNPLLEIFTAHDYRRRWRRRRRLTAPFCNSPSAPPAHAPPPATISSPSACKPRIELSVVLITWCLWNLGFQNSARSSACFYSSTEAVLSPLTAVVCLSALTESRRASLGHKAVGPLRLCHRPSTESSAAKRR